MDFIKIPQLHSDDTCSDIILRISDIKYVTYEVFDNTSRIYLRDEVEIIKSPMSVAKIYDLIWQTELSNESHDARCPKGVFQHQSQVALRKSKALEAEIDREIKRVRDLGYGQLKPAKQPTLFSGSDDDNKPAVPNDLYQH